MKLTEETIPDFIRQGRDKEAIQSLYKNVLPNVKKYVKNNNGNSEEAFDIFQDAVLSFYQSVMENKFDSRYKVYGYVYRICVYRWINKATREKISFKEELPEMQIDTPTYWFSETATGEEEALLRKLFSSIGEKCLELLTYTIFKDMQMEDITIRMNFPSESAARMQHVRCKEKMMNEIEKKPELLSILKGL